MPPVLSGAPGEVAAATTARHAALAEFIAAGRAAHVGAPDLLDLWPDDPTDLDALLVLADRCQEHSDTARADELRDVVAHVRWADTSRLWRTGPEVPLAHRAVASRTLRHAQPGTVASDAFDRRPPVPPTAQVPLGADEGRLARDVAAALAAEPDVFAREADGALVYVHPARGTGEPLASELTSALLSVRVADAVHLMTHAGAPATLPGRIARAVLEDRNRTGFRRLAGIVHRPVVAADGTVIADRRYHRPTGLLVCPPPGLSRDVPVAPTRGDAIAAVDVLLDVVCDFPFASAADRSAWLAVVLSPIVRPMYDGPTPWLVAVGNAAGVGKGLLLDIAGLILSGAPLARSVWSPSAEVTRRMIDAQFLAGAAVHLFDNMRGRVGNAVFDAALTACRWEFRGTSGPLRTVWLGTGNDLEWGADARRRVLPIRLRTALARPEARGEFRHARLGEYALARRGRLLSAALTVVRAWVSAGRPRTNLPAWGSFAGWSDVVREMLVWAGQPDPIETQTPAPAFSQDEHAGGVFEAVRQLCASRTGSRSRGVTAADLVEAAGATGPDRPEWQAELARALTEVLNGSVTTLATGHHLRSLAGQVIGGRRLERVPTNTGTAARAKEGMLWRVVSVVADAERPT